MHNLLLKTPGSALVYTPGYAHNYTCKCKPTNTLNIWLKGALHLYRHPNPAEPEFPHRGSTVNQDEQGRSFITVTEKKSQDRDRGLFLFLWRADRQYFIQPHTAEHEVRPMKNVCGCYSELCAAPAASWGWRWRGLRKQRNPAQSLCFLHFLIPSLVSLDN